MPLVKTLHRAPGKVRERLSIRGKDGSVTGCRAALKSIQSYPKAVGEAVAGVIRQLAVKKAPSDLIDDDLADLLVKHIADKGGH